MRRIWRIPSARRGGGSEKARRALFAPDDSGEQTPRHDESANSASSDLQPKKCVVFLVGCVAGPNIQVEDSALAKE